jgi:hypothetical protein
MQRDILVSSFCFQVGQLVAHYAAADWAAATDLALHDAPVPEVGAVQLTHSLKGAWFQPLTL